MTHRITDRRLDSTFAADQLALVWHSAALLLAPPSASLLAQLESVHRATHRLPDELGGPLRATIVHLERATLPQLEQEYAATFHRSDLDGAAAERLSLMLELAATTDVATGCSLLLIQAPGLEELQASLLGTESGWVGAVTSVLATLAVCEPGRRVVDRAAGG